VRAPPGEPRSRAWRVALVLGVLGSLVGAIVLEWWWTARPERYLQPFRAAYDEGDLTGPEQIERLRRLHGFESVRPYLGRLNELEPRFAYDPERGAFFLLRRVDGEPSRLLYVSPGYQGAMGLPIYYDWDSVRVRADRLELRGNAFEPEGGQGLLERAGLTPGRKRFLVPLDRLVAAGKPENLRTWEVPVGAGRDG